MRKPHWSRIPSLEARREEVVHELCAAVDDLVHEANTSELRARVNRRANEEVDARLARLEAMVEVMGGLLIEKGVFDVDSIQCRIDAAMQARQAPPPQPDSTAPVTRHSDGPYRGAAARSEGIPPARMARCVRCATVLPAASLLITEYGTACDPCQDAMRDDGWID
jgi:hypothetical protein